MVHLLIDIEKEHKGDRISLIKARKLMLNTLCKIAKEWIEIEHFSRVTENYLTTLNPKSIILSGNRTPWEYYDKEELEKFMKVIRSWKRPLLGICGGHQLLAMAYGGKVDVIRKAKRGEPTDKPGGFYYGYLLETGMRPVNIIIRDPIFEGLPEVIIVDEGHFCEVKELPKGFIILASNDISRVQAMRHKELPIYGVQFHPHIFNDKYPHGRIILENFFRIVKNFKK